jgi:hypothetical protein
VSEARRRHPDPRRGHPQAQPPEPLWGRGHDAIDLQEAVKFRRSLDEQGSTDLIPMAGPDAAADQGPAIKAVWEPMAPESSPEGHRRRAQDSRTHTRRAPRRGSGKRRTLIFGSAAAVVLVGAAVADLNDGNPTPVKGAATTVLPMVTDSSSTVQQARDGELGQATQDPSHHASRSPSSSPSPSHTAGRSAGPPSGSPSPGAPTASPTAPTTTPTPTKSSPNCFLIFCG